MALDIYWITLILLLPTVVLVSGRGFIVQRFHRLRKEKDANSTECEPQNGGLNKAAEGRVFRRMFLEVYLLVMGSEWLQGPYLYSLLRDEKNLEESTVASMYVAAYIGAAAAALVTGFLADRFGRRAACLVFCAVHTLSCFTVLSNQLPVLYAGRALAGVALTLLWTVFESWMVTEYHARGLDRSTLSLGGMFGLMTTSNCMAAILGGVVGHCIVLVLRSRTIPFVAGVTLEATAVVLILRNWNENYGQPTTPKSSQAPIETKGLLGDPKVWVLSFVTCCFEGTNFLVLFFWPGILQDAHKAAHPDGTSEAPYGVIFATFMAAMILGAQLFSAVVCDDDSHDTDQGQHRGRLTRWLRMLLASNYVLGIANLLAGVSLVAAVYLTHEAAILCAFLAFEVCNGVYVPCIAYQRGIVVGEASRTGMYGLMKLPLFVFVVTALLTAVEDPHHRRAVFGACFVALCLASVASIIGLRHGRHGEKLPGSDPEDMEFELRDCVDSSEDELESTRALNKSHNVATS